MYRFILMPLLVIILTCLDSPKVFANELPGWFIKAFEQMSGNPYYNYKMQFDDGEHSATLKVSAVSPNSARVTVLVPAIKKQVDGLGDKVKAMQGSITSETLWCLSILDEHPKALKLISETESELVFSTLFDGAPKTKVHMAITLGTENMNIRSIRKWGPQKYKPGPFVKFTTFDMMAECAQSPDGRAYTKSVDFRMVGSGFGNKIDRHIRQNISDLEVQQP